MKVATLTLTFLSRRKFLRFGVFVAKVGHVFCRGHQLAAQMENTNPNFVENLRRNLVDPQGREETQAEPTPENTDEKPGEPGV